MNNELNRPKNREKKTNIRERKRKKNHIHSHTHHTYAKYSSLNKKKHTNQKKKPLAYGMTDKACYMTSIDFDRMRFFSAW